MAHSFKIVSYEFKKPVKEAAAPHRLLSEHAQGSNWPVVYLIHGNKEIYVGETNSANDRMNQHLDPKGDNFADRKKLGKVEIIFDSWFNKSAVLDIENSLIGLLRYEIRQTKDESRRSKYFIHLQNGNRGQSKLHNYYNRARYQEEVEGIWDELRKRSIATNKYSDIVNDVLFKYSPYTTLNEEQQSVSLEILNGIMDSLEAIQEGRGNGFTAVVKGDAGTGKTIVLVNMLVRIVEAMFSNQTNIDAETKEDDDSSLESERYTYSLETLLIDRIKRYVRKYGVLKIAYVAQMSSLRGTMGTILKEVPHMHKKDAKGPNDIVNTSVTEKGEIVPYDIIFVDEAHRLWQYNNIGSAVGAYKKACAKLYGTKVKPKTVTTLDWLCKCSRTRVLVYDPFQTVKDSDITPKQFENTINKESYGLSLSYELHQQMRCRAGMDYISFVNDLFEGRLDSLRAQTPDHYDFRLYDDANELINEIINRDAEVGLSKCVTGYGWQWKKKKYDECERKYTKLISDSKQTDSRKKRVEYYVDNLKTEDGLIVFNGVKYVRNLDYEWILKGDPREIGCIHTSQGYDLNYVGVLLGPEINYCPGKGIYVSPELIMDTGVRRNLEGLTRKEYKRKYETIRTYVINAYKVMMERGIKGCYIYAHNDDLKDYLRKVLKDSACIY